jgi:hypothetical protein
MRACRFISAELCPSIMEVKMGTERRGSRMTKRAAKE